ncbi:MAG: UDP-N-acetylmuramoyl-L-alanine--D-glutamate ligase [Clostridia bacterium]|nr:UDP-N-acetylmuramoyl-L-alanine--D-glutamate ligase [Clostridia bacterium]
MTFFISIRNSTFLGFGRAGRAATCFFLAQGAQVSVYAREPVPDREAFSARGVRFYEGALVQTLDAELVLRSPGIRPDIPPLASMQGRVIEESQLALLLTPAHTVGVTGSDGKTTTSALIAAILQEAGERVFLGGNNGTPLLPRVGEMRAEDTAVFELSSFQLTDAVCAPEVAVITNITPNHLDWHRDFAEYLNAKRNILRGVSRAALNVATRDLLALAPDAPPIAFFSADEQPLSLRPCDLYVFTRGDALVVRSATGEKYLPALSDFSLPGRHNRENLVAAVAALWGRVPTDAICRAVAAFRGVAHRLQYVATVDGVAYYNSSIDTSPSRTAAALAALGRRPIVIVGGRGKGIPLAPLADALALHARAAVAYGDTREEICGLLQGRLPAVSRQRFADAFAAAAEMAVTGDTVLLSPGCTAFGEFRDFEERGECFCRLVGALAERK